ncbi:MAG: C39 family peptidase [Actinomycetaceae bacterium]|nr:C39 family peptidase [Actinomycetaceae bacterium]
MTVRANGELWLHTRGMSGQLLSSRRIGTGWGGMKFVLTGADFDGDHNYDVLGLRYDGDLFLYSGNGIGGFKSTRKIGNGWHNFDQVVMVEYGPGQKPALLAQRGTSVLIYPTNGAGRWQPILTASIPGGLTATTFAAGNLGGTGYETLVRSADTGDLEVLQTADGRVFEETDPISLPEGPVVFGATTGFESGTSGSLDVVDKSGTLVRYPLVRKDAGTALPIPEEVPAKWNAISFASPRRSGNGWPAAGVYSMGDFNRDGVADMALVKADGRFLFYAGKSADGGFVSGRQIGSGWNGFTILSGSDVTGDGTPDVVARNATGNLVLYPGNGSGRFSPSRVIGYSWQGFTNMWLLRDGPNGNPAIYVTYPDGRLGISTSNGRGTFYSVKPSSAPASMLPPSSRTFASDDWDNNGRADLLSIDKDGYLFVLPQNLNGGFGTPRRIGNGWNNFKSLHIGNFTATYKRIHGVRSNGDLYTYTAKYSGGAGAFSNVAGAKSRYASKVQVSGSWLTHPIAWTGQPNSVTCGPTSMYMVLRYLGAGNSRYDGKPLTVWNLAGPTYANVGSGYSGGTSWEQSRISLGINRWRGNSDYKQWAFPSGSAFDSKVRNSFYTGRPVLVDTIETYGGPHYNGHAGWSSHIVVAYRYNTATGTVGFVDPGGPGSAITGYSAQRYFDYNNAVRFGNNFLGNYGGGGHGMAY